MKPGRNTQVCRQWTVMRALAETTNGLTVGDICSYLRDKVTPRTVYRDLSALSDVFPVTKQKDEDSDETRYRIDRDDLTWLPSPAESTEAASS